MNWRGWPVVAPLAGVARTWLRQGFHRRMLCRAQSKRMRRQLSCLTGTLPPADPQRLALVLVLQDDFPLQLAQDGMRALALRLDGWTPVALLLDRTQMGAESQLRSFGIERFAYLSDHPLSVADHALVRSETERFLATADSFQAVKSWCFRGAWIGSQVISTIARQTFEGAPDPRDPAIRTRLAGLVPRAMGWVLQAERLLSSARWQLATVVEANYAAGGAVVDAAIAAGIPVLQAIQPCRDDAMVLKRLDGTTRRIHPFSLSRTTLDRLMAGPWGDNQERELEQEFADRYGGRWALQARNTAGTEPYDRNRLVGELGLDPGKGIAVVFSQVLWDANLFYGEDLFSDFSDWFVQTVQAACANPAVNWLVKLHPANVWKRSLAGVEGEYAEIRLIRERIGALPPHVRLLPADTRIPALSLFTAADWGTTVRGTVGIEAPCFGMPLLTAGTGRYSHLGFTVDSASREEYLARLAGIAAIPRLSPEQKQRARRHAHAVFRRRIWRMRSFRLDRPGKADAELVPTFASLEEIKANGDLALFAAWAASGEADYLDDGD